MSNADAGTPDDARLSDEEWEQRAKDEWLSIRWDQARGIDSFDRNNYVIFVRSSVEETARVLAAEKGRRERDVLGREITLEVKGAIVFQLRGHVWTEILGLERPGLAKWLSGILGVRVIEYGISDTTEVIHCTLYDRGAELESFGGMRGGFDDEPSAEVYFSSSLRQISPDAISDIWKFTSDFLAEQAVFDPGIDLHYFLDRQYGLEPGCRLTISNPGFILVVGGEHLLRRPDIERVDYVIPGEVGVTTTSE